MQKPIFDRILIAIKADELKPEILTQINGIIISKNQPAANVTVVGIPWKYDASAYKMKMPSIIFDIDEFEDGWQEDMAQLAPYIKSLYIITPIDDLNFIRNFTACEELYVKYSDASDWSFLSALTRLRMLFVRKCPNFDINSLELIVNNQAGNFWHNNRLGCVYIGYCNISDLSVFRKIDYLSELDLSHNNIEDITPLADVNIGWLTLRYNKLRDISVLPSSLYALNIRHNEVTELPDLYVIMSSEFSRLYIAHNPIKDFTPANKLSLVDYDFDYEELPFEDFQNEDTDAEDLSDIHAYAPLPELIINASESQEIQLHLYDTPFVMDITIRGGLKHISLIEKEGETFLWVETFGNDCEQMLIIEVHPTGTLLPDADKVTYLGTAMVGKGIFVWHIFYLLREDNDALAENDFPTDEEPLYENLSTIYKYGFTENGNTAIDIVSSCVKPLYAGLQNGRLALWVLLKLEDESTARTILNIISSTNNIEDGYTLLNEVILNDDSKQNVFYQVVESE